MATEMEPEDGRLWIYDTDDQQTIAFTPAGMEYLREMLAEYKRNRSSPRSERTVTIDFATLNGWKYSEASFAPSMLARGSTQRKRREAWDEGWVHELFDHPGLFP